ncbi:MAG: lantibiotic dehydratase [Adhaeribacter sp.]
MKLFPYILTRIGGGSYENLAQVDYSALNRQVGQLLARQQEKIRLKAQLCTRLLEGIKTLPDQKIQNQVLNLRRDIFNQRTVKPQLLVVAQQYLPKDLNADLEAYLTFADNLKSEEEKTAATYAQLLYASRQHLQQLAHDESLQKGLVLSSQSLLNALKDYTQQNPDNFRKKEFQTEQSLLKYLTRMYTKTSPFSTFNNLALGTLASLPNEVIRVKTNPEAEKSVVSHIRLNNNLFKYLKDLFIANNAIYPHLQLRANPTIEQKADHYVYLTNHNNVDAFQRIPLSPVLGLILQVVQANHAGIRFAQLVSEICEYVDASDENIQAYLRQLTSYGFLEFDLGVSGTDPDWDLKLITQLAYLEQQEVSHIAELNETLHYIRQQANQYDQGTVPERQQILNQVYARFRNICMKLHEAAGLPEIERKTPKELQAEWLIAQKEAEGQKNGNGQQAAAAVLVAEEEAAATPKEKVFEHKSSTYFGFKPEQLLYEDTVRGIDVQLDEAQLNGLVENLHNLLQEVRLFRGMADEQDLMRQYFKQKYGTDGQINLLNFYEDFYREIKKPEAEWLARKQQENNLQDKTALQTNPAENAVELKVKEQNRNNEQTPTLNQNTLIESHTEKTKGWLQNFVAAMQPLVATPAQQVDISLGLIRQITGTATEPEKEKLPDNSYGAFVQLYQEQDAAGEWQLKGVLNASLPGYSKMISRFLHILPDAVAQTAKDWNTALQPPDSLFIENCDASYFNANLHPPLMPYEIRMPGGHNSLPVENQLPISDFEVSLNEPADELQLIHKPTGKRSYVFDLGFQAHGGRSQLFQLLDKFTRAEYLFTYPVVSAVNAAVEKNISEAEAAKAEPRILVRPRIVYQNQLTIQRKGWYVPKTLIPQRQPDWSDWHYYLALNTWRQAQNIVDEVYVTIAPNRQQTGLNPEQTKKLGRDDYKPQYINFNDPLFVLLFEKLLAKVPDSLKIEEMLPNSKYLLQLDKQRFVTECVVQWQQ